LAAGALAEAPATEVMRAGDDAGPHGFGDPDLVHEVADPGGDLDKPARDDVQPGGVVGMQPQRVAVRDLVEPLGVARARVDERRKTEGGKKHHFSPSSIDL